MVRGKEPLHKLASARGNDSDMGNKQAFAMEVVFELRTGLAGKMIV
jgi:hypothetical protein